MSTYYYLACDLCKQQVPFWSCSAGGAKVIPTANKYPETVQDFLDAHLKHNPVVFSEHDDRHAAYEDVLERYPEIGY